MYSIWRCGRRFATAALRSPHLLTIVVLLGACTDSTPARIAVPGDTLVINTLQWTPFSKSVLNKAGREIRGALVTYRSVPDSLLEFARDGSVLCRGDGAGALTLTADTAHAELPVRCRIVRRFSRPNASKLIVGGPPVPLGIQAYDAEGSRLDPVRLRLVISDTAIIKLVNGLVYGLRPGASSIGAHSGLAHGVQIFFVDPAAGKDSTHAHDR